MKTLIQKLVDKEAINDKDLQEELYKICCDIHASCNENCPVYEKNGDIPWGEDKNNRTNCICFKDGKKMLKFLRAK